MPNIRRLHNQIRYESDADVAYQEMDKYERFVELLKRLTTSDLLALKIEFQEFLEGKAAFAEKVYHELKSNGGGYEDL